MMIQAAMKFLRELKPKSVDTMVEEWTETFPNRCIICAYWRYGRHNYLTNKATPSTIA